MKAITTRYHGPTNTKGSRYSAFCEGRRVYVGCDNALNADENHAEAAKKLRLSFGWDRLKNAKMVGGWVANGDMVWVFEIGGISI